jgi:hypothetical protein
LNKTIALTLILTAAVQPAFACGGGYSSRVHAVHMTHVTHAAPKVHAKVETKAAIAEQPTTAPVASTGAVNSATVAPSAECKKYFPSVGAVVAVPCSG